MAGRGSQLTTMLLLFGVVALGLSLRDLVTDTLALFSAGAPAGISPAVLAKGILANRVAAHDARRVQPLGAGCNTPKTNTPVPVSSQPWTLSVDHIPIVAGLAFVVLTMCKVAIDKLRPGTLTYSAESAMLSVTARDDEEVVPSAVSRREFQAGALALGLALPMWPSAEASAATAGPSPVPSAKVGDLEVSRIIQGHWQLAGGHGREPLEDPSANMRNHYNAGIYTFDTADIYGPSQELIGEYLRSDKPEGAVVCTKFCCFNGLDRIDREAVRRGIKRSMLKLGVKQLDLVAFFWGDWRVKNYVQTALYLKELKEEGLIKEIGVTNFDVAHLKELVDAGVPVVSNQVQYSLMDRRPENGMVQYCAETGIKIIAFGTVCSGFLSEKYLGAPRPTQISNYSESLYSTSIAKAGGWPFLQQLLPVLDGVAKKHGVTIANVAERWVLQQPQVAAIIVGVRNSNHIQENVNTFSFELDADDLASISAILAKEVPPAGDIWFRERGLI